MFADPEDGYCQASGSINYPSSYVSDPDIGATALGDWCKSWCERVQPEKLVAIGTYVGEGSACYCFFDANNLPAGFNDPAPNDAFKAQYGTPAADSLDSVATGTGCIADTTGDTDDQCYRNCALSKCVSIYSCLS